MLSNNDQGNFVFENSFKKTASLPFGTCPPTAIAWFNVNITYWISSIKPSRDAGVKGWRWVAALQEDG